MATRIVLEPNGPVIYRFSKTKRLSDVDGPIRPYPKKHITGLVNQIRPLTSHYLIRLSGVNSSADTMAIREALGRYQFLTNSATMGFWCPTWPADSYWKSYESSIKLLTVAGQLSDGILDRLFSQAADAIPYDVILHRANHVIYWSNASWGIGTLFGDLQFFLNCRVNPDGPMSQPFHMLIEGDDPLPLKQVRLYLTPL